MPWGWNFQCPASDEPYQQEAILKGVQRG